MLAAIETCWQRFLKKERQADEISRVWLKKSKLLNSLNLFILSNFKTLTRLYKTGILLNSFNLLISFFLRTASSDSSNDGSLTLPRLKEIVRVAGPLEETRLCTNSTS